MFLIGGHLQEVVAHRGLIILQWNCPFTPSVRSLMLKCSCYTGWLLPYRTGRLCTHKNSDFGLISVTERSYTELISEGVDRCSYFT